LDIASVLLFATETKDWVSPLASDRALVGRIYEVAGDRVVTPKTLRDALVSADVVLLGEQHDNVDHHRLQAVLLKGMIDSGRRPAVAFEQIDLEN
jgi:uncharacterized iron-regulated protein